MKVGMVCLKIAGRDAGKLAVVVNILKKGYVLIDGDLRRRKCNILHLEPLGKSVNIKENASTDEVAEELKKNSLIKEIKKRTKKEKKSVQIKKREKVKERADEIKDGEKKVKKEAKKKVSNEGKASTPRTRRKTK